jgi:hypothetical protein
MATHIPAYSGEREHMKQDVTAYMRSYNQERLHLSNDDMSPVKFEISQIKVYCLG